MLPPKRLAETQKYLIFESLSSYKESENKEDYPVEDVRICMVSTLPPEGGGVSTYTKSLLESFDLPNAKITVISRKSKSVSVMKTENFPTKKITVFPCWTPGFLYPFKIFKAFCRYRPKLIHIQHEYFIFGGTLSASLFPFLLLFTRLLDSKIVVTLHGIVNPSEVKDPELGVNSNGKIGGLFSHIGLLLVTRLITDNSDKITVMNNAHKNVLIQQYRCSSKKIVLIPHGVPQSQPIDQEQAKKMLGLNCNKVVLYFGYITKYKGIDILIKAFKKIEGSNVVLLIGGAPHPRLKNDPEYLKFWNSVNKEMSEDRRIRFVGFIPDKILSTYISAADVVVFPYIASFSTGGPMNITLGYHRPIIASRVSSFSDILPAAAVFKTGSVFDLYFVLNKALNDADFNRELSECTRDIAEDRSWKKVAQTTADLYFNLLKKQNS